MREVQLTLLSCRIGSLAGSGFVIILILKLNAPFTVQGQTIEDSNICLDFGDFQQLNVWSPVSKCSLTNANVPEERYWPYRQPRAGETLVVAAYQRGPYLSPDWQQDKLWRILVYLGNNENITWVYVPAVNSWMKFYLHIQPSRRVGHTMNSWCKTNVILFGGTDIQDSLFNETWIFSGETETWQKQDVEMWIEGTSVPARYGHTAVVITQPLSNCTCQESMLVFGGISGNGQCLGDLWEMRCIADSTGKPRFYWIPL